MIKFESEKYLWEVCSILTTFIPNQVEGLKPKRDTQLRKVFDPLYTMNDEKLLFLENLIRQDIIIASHGLASNDQVVMPLCKEYAKVMSLCDSLRVDIKGLKQFPEIKDYYDRLFQALNKKELEKCFVSDIKTLNESFGLDIDISDMVQILRNKKDDFDKGNK